MSKANHDFWGAIIVVTVAGYLPSDPAFSAQQNSSKQKPPP
jgi:hypothetical protein